jgi:hypothetical protein
MPRRLTLLLAALLLITQACGLAPQPTPPPTPSPTLAPTATSVAPAPATPTEAPPSPTATLTATPAPTPSAALIDGPYLQSVTASSIIVAWDTDEASTGEVVYGETADYTTRLADPAPATRHALTLVGLRPYTTYHYRLESNGWPLTEDFTFRTAADASQPSFTFAVFGDTRTGHDRHRSVVDRLLALEPDIALHTGDLVTSGSSAADWETFLSIERPLMARVPIFPTLGNHEQDNPFYFDLFYLPGNERWYAFDYGPARFVCLEIDGIASFGRSSEQYTWLEATLAANTQPWLFVYFHVPPYSALSEDDFQLAVREMLVPLFQQYSVDAVFNGHHHDYQRILVNGITYIVTGGGGAETYPVTQPYPGLLAYYNGPHVVYFTLTGETLTGQAMTPEGEIFDTFSLTPRP